MSHDLCRTRLIKHMIHTSNTVPLLQPFSHQKEDFKAILIRRTFRESLGNTGCLGKKVTTRFWVD